MTTLREALQASWARDEGSMRQVAAEMPMPDPVSLRALIVALGQVESRTFTTAIHTTNGAPINGRGSYEVCSDGRYRVSGHMRATGFYSYDYGLNLWLRLPDGNYLASVHSGSVYGTDTPGDRQHPFEQNGTNPVIAARWRQIRGANLTLAHSMHAELGGVLGTAADLVDFLARGVVLNGLLGPSGWVLVLGHELADLGIAGDAQSVWGSLLVAGGQVLLAGPFGLVPVLVGGLAAAEVLNLATDVKDRGMRPEEIAFARRIFSDTIDYDRVRITNLHQNGDNGERAFVMPGRGGSILVNLGTQGWDRPLSYIKPNSNYLRPGQLFVHELVHAWQVTQRSLVGLISDLGGPYPYTPGDSAARLIETGWRNKSWGSFNNEQQAHIVDDWYEAQVARLPAGTLPAEVHWRVDLDGVAARDDPAFRFVRDHIRLANP